jgi:hypothetical protein
VGELVGIDVGESVSTGVRVGDPAVGESVWAGSGIENVGGAIPWTGYRINGVGWSEELEELVVM